MGLWRDVILSTSAIGEPTPAVTCRYPGVHTSLRSGNTAADVQVTAELLNWGETAVSGTFQVNMDPLAI